MKDAIVNLVKTKSIMTLLLTLTFCVGVFISMFMAIEIPPALVNVYMIVVGFYFGTQTGKKTEDDIKYVEEPVGEAGMYEEVVLEDQNEQD